MADSASWCCALVLLSLILVGSTTRERNNNTSKKPDYQDDTTAVKQGTSRGHLFERRPCDEIYVVGEGETLHTISDKCGDPFIVERNPHIHDPDDVFPGLVIKIITPQLHQY